MRGKVTFNGYGFDECVVGRTSAYVDQVDNHIAELTVRETLDFAARVQGAGFGAALRTLNRSAPLALADCPVTVTSICHINHYHYRLFLPDEARHICRQAAGKGCHKDIPCWTCQIQARLN